MCSGGQGGGRQGGGGVSHIGAGIILSASCSLALFCFMFEVKSWKFLLFQFMVQNLREVSLHHIIISSVKFRKICIEKYMKMSLIHYFFLQM